VAFADKDVPYYRAFFSGKDHVHYLGFDDIIGPVVISAECDCGTKPKVRTIIRMQRNEERVLVPTGASVVKLLQAVKPNLGCVRFLKVKDDDLNAELEKFERHNVIKTYKFGVLYCGPGQTREDEMFANVKGSDNWEAFLSFLGDRIVLEGWKGYRGGLDVRQNSTGTHSVHSHFRTFEIMFHVAPLLPFMEDDPQQLERKRHLGNDVVLIIFKEGDGKVDVASFCSHFNHVFFVVSPVVEKGVKYLRVATANKPGVVPHKPFLPDPARIPMNDLGHDILLLKAINAERSAMHAPEFRDKFVKTRYALLQDMVETYSNKKKKQK